jgi:hypothetical protein
MSRDLSIQLGTWPDPRCGVRGYPAPQGIFGADVVAVTLWNVFERDHELNGHQLLGTFAEE